MRPFVAMVVVLLLPCFAVAATQTPMQQLIGTWSCSFGGTQVPVTVTTLTEPLPGIREVDQYPKVKMAGVYTNQPGTNQWMVTMQVPFKGYYPKPPFSGIDKNLTATPVTFATFVPGQGGDRLVEEFTSITGTSFHRVWREKLWNESLWRTVRTDSCTRA